MCRRQVLVKLARMAAVVRRKATGGVVNAIIKAGTNSFHGDVYEFIRNSALDSRDYFSRSGNTPLAQFRRNQFGALRVC